MAAAATGAAAAGLVLALLVGADVSWRMMRWSVVSAPAVAAKTNGPVPAGSHIPRPAGTEKAGRHAGDAAGTPATGASPASPLSRANRLTRTALLLAGLRGNTGTAGMPLPSSKIWQDYARQFDKSWKRWETGQLAKIQAWGGRELATLGTRSEWLYYPFGGPDFLYAAALFPRARVYFLAGLEPAGEVVLRDELSDADLEPVIAMAWRQLQDVFGLTFFRFNDLKEIKESLDTVDLLFIFLARLGFEILEATPVYIDKNAMVVPLDTPSPSDIDEHRVRGVRISFRRPGETAPATLFYFKIDLSNTGMKANPEYLELVNKMPRPTVLLKAASYLLQHMTFSVTRGQILGRGLAVLQDDSGIALGKFDPAHWSTAFFGNYVGPIDMFTDFYQEDLKQAFASKPAGPLGFGIGYRFRPKESCLILAAKRQGEAEGAAAPPPALTGATADGVALPCVLARGRRPELVLSFSSPVDPDRTAVFLKDNKSPGLIRLDVRWDDFHRRATTEPPSPLNRRSAYTIVVGPAAGEGGGGGDPAAEERTIYVPEADGLALEDKTVLVDRRDQLVFLCGKDGGIFKTYACATGSYYPKAGTYRVFGKTAKAKSLFDDAQLSYFTIFEKSETGYNVGFHALPVYPDGHQEGELGRPTSHGCVRLSLAAAKALYEWAPLRTKVVVD